MQHSSCGESKEQTLSSLNPCLPHSSLGLRFLFLTPWERNPGYFHEDNYSQRISSRDWDINPLPSHATTGGLQPAWMEQTGSTSVLMAILENA